MNRLARRNHYNSDQHLDERAKILDATDDARLALEQTQAALRNGIIMPGEAIEIVECERRTVVSLQRADATSRQLQRDMDEFTRYLASLPREAVAMLPHEPLPRDLVLEGMQMTLAFQPAARRESVGATMRQREVA